ncbi:chromosome segregation protein SMC [Hyalangium rubrum]|uniref:Chromosome segregation protein SMC n=1 Tax=Hyalangium rubrum TaxID=3103134 RepID=A0ABU5H7G9_9BACT|nr:chromosome segregation protein SMC [Hyalangium sp. s54d21]MDY7228702.1 chromosome segregation protein SMC [Hyalangium sp. s54d21]
MHPRVLLFLAVAFCISACPKAPPPLPAAAPTEQQRLVNEVKGLAEQAQALLETQNRLIWEHWTEGKPVNIAATYTGTESLFSVENIRKMDRLRQLTQDARELRALTALQSHFAGEYLAQQLAEYNDAIANLEASLTFSVDGREVRYRDLERLLANEKSAVKRRALYAAAVPAIERLSQSLRRREERTEELVKELGYASYEAFSSELRQTDLSRLSLLAEEILQATQEPYRVVMERLAQRELALPFASLTRADIPRLFRSREVEDAFPKEESLLRAHASVQGLGIDLTEMPNIYIDARDLPRKNPRPLTLAIEVPKDVRLSVKPASGVLHQARVLHEYGHALHYGFTREQRFELARLGNPTVGEAYSALFEDLLEDPVWLEEHAGVRGDQRAQYLAASSAHKLFLIRRAAGRLLYQLGVHREGTDAKELYRAIMERTDAMPMTPEDTARYLVDQEDFFQSADNFRGWFLAGQLQGQLKARFGPAWWRSPEAGAFLKGLWAQGNALSAREVAEAIGERGIAPDVLLLRLGTTLQVPITLDAQTTEEPPAPPAPAPAPAPPPEAPAPSSTPDAGT